MACNSTCWSQHSSQHRRGTGQKPSEVFRTDLITAMKVPDSYALNPEDFYFLADPWRQEWEKGVQVPVSPHSIPQPIVRVLSEKGREVMFVRPKKLIRTSGSEALGYVDIRTLAEGTCRYDLDEEDVAWLHEANEEFSDMALPRVDEASMERVLEELERRCHENMAVAVETQEGLGIEFDEDVVCDVCRSPDGEENNEMVFCDKCNICVHQACYGIQKVPTGSWLCRICALGILPKCQLCPKNGGAMKPTRSGTKWVHVSCALWIPEVSIGNPEKMEPITNVSHIPSNRWALICCICKEKTGACIQCSAKNCRSAFHVTCCQHAGLEMNTILTEEEEVKFKAFCPKHSGLEGSEDTQDPAGENQSPKNPKRTNKRDEESVAEAEKRVNQRKLKLQEMEDEFYKFVDPEEVASYLKIARETVDFLFQYWKLKRKANFNRPLVTPKKDEEDSLARREQEVLRRRLQLFTHLRQDLERVRNLTYMVTRREKMKRSMWRIQEQIFQHQVRLLDHKLLSGDPSAKDLERLLSLGLVTSQTPLNHSSSSKSRKSKHHKKKKRRKSREHRDLTHSSPSQKPSLQTDGQPHNDITCEALEAKFELQNEEIQPQNVEQFEQEVAVKVESKRSEDGEALRHKRNLKKQEKRKKSTQNGFKDRQLSIHLVDIRHKDSDSYVMYGNWEANDPNLRLKANPMVPNGLSKKHHTNGTANGRSWGKFRIPKRKFENEDLNKQRKAMLKPLTNSKQRLDTDSDLKRCNGNEATLTRRYDFIRRGVLAS
ncbi:protein Jade-1 [Boleophthalmus pectinirostris]|uniref:protein Jade-1 n=1 Tax=Boleophthalmus pectinirostris TaxID=150288 RepID=UPI002430C454|nr:protein Jade-1 [Boleophthalmus pectinirostris]